MSDIFISYSREDKEKVQQLAQALENEGWSIWWDPHIPAGKNFDDVIEQALETAKSVIVLWSVKSVDSRWVRTEASEALDRSILVPVLIDDVRVPLAFRRVQTADLTAWDGSRSFPAFRKLVEDLAGIIGPRPGQVEGEAKSQAEELEVKKGENDTRRQVTEMLLEDKAVISPVRDTPVGSKKGPMVGLGIVGLVALLFFFGLQFREGNIEQASNSQAHSTNTPEPTQTVTQNNSEKPLISPSKDSGEKVIKPEMVVIPAGTFNMGGNEVKVQEFAIGRYEVTFEDYEYFTKAKGWDTLDDNGWGKETRPVIHVSWKDAAVYAKWLSEKTGKSYRLPTEEEWEYAARCRGEDEKCEGMPATDKPGGDAWTIKNSKKMTHPIGETEPNGLKLYDMSGNVWEWVQNPSKDDNSDRRIIRGGSWADDGTWDLRSEVSVRDRDRRFGFRLAQDCNESSPCTPPEN